MPQYVYCCAACDRLQTAYRTIAARHDAPACCGVPSVLCIVAPAVQPDLPGYASPVTGKWVEGKAARREDLRRHHCRPYEEGEREHAKRAQADEARREDAAIHTAAAQAYYALSPEKRRIVRGAT